MSVEADWKIQTELASPSSVRASPVAIPSEEQIGLHPDDAEA
jgi:hypothetical protein